MDATPAFYRKLAKRVMLLLLLLLLVVSCHGRSPATDADLPQKTVNVTCLVHNWEIMACRWRLDGRKNVTSRLYYRISTDWRECPHPDYTPTSSSCTWYKYDGDLLPGLGYYLRLTLTDTNLTTDLRVVPQLVRTSDIVVPAPVINLQPASVNNTCMTLTWSHSDTEHHKVARVNYFSGCQLHLEVPFKRSPVTATLCRLFPNALYNVSVVVHGYRDSSAAHLLVNTSASEWGGFYSLRPNTTVVYWKTYPKCDRIQLYRVCHVASGANCTVVDDSWLELPLDRQTDHRLEVIIVLQDGQPLFAEPQSIFVPASENAPPPVTNVVLETDFEVFFLVTWTCDASCNASVDSFLVAWCPGNTTSNTCYHQESLEWRRVNSSVTHYWDKLPADTRHNEISHFIFGVAVLNTFGIVSSIKWVDCMYPLHTPLNKPGEVSVTATGPEQLLLTWDTQLPCDTLSAYVYQYKIRYGYQRGHHQYMSELYVTRAVGSVTLNDLEPGTLYQVSLVAVSTPRLQRESPESLAPPVTTLALPKSEPPDPVAIKAAVTVSVLVPLACLLVAALFVMHWSYKKTDSKFAKVLFPALPIPVSQQETRPSGINGEQRQQHALSQAVPLPQEDAEPSEDTQDSANLSDETDHLLPADPVQLLPKTPLSCPMVRQTSVDSGVCCMERGTPPAVDYVTVCSHHHAQPLLPAASSGLSSYVMTPSAQTPSMIDAQSQPSRIDSYNADVPNLARAWLDYVQDPLKQDQITDYVNKSGTYVPSDDVDNKSGIKETTHCLDNKAPSPFVAHSSRCNNALDVITHDSGSKATTDTQGYVTHSHNSNGTFDVRTHDLDIKAATDPRGYVTHGPDINAIFDVKPRGHDTRVATGTRGYVTHGLDTVVATDTRGYVTHGLDTRVTTKTRGYVTHGPYIDEIFDVKPHDTDKIFDVKPRGHDTRVATDTRGYVTHGLDTVVATSVVATDTRAYVTHGLDTRVAKDTPGYVTHGPDINEIFNVKSSAQSN